MRTLIARTLVLLLLVSAFSLQPSAFAAAAYGTTTNDYPAATTRPQKTDQSVDLLWRLVTAAAAGHGTPMMVGAVDVISPATVPVYPCGAAGTTPTVSGNVYALSTNEFFTVTNGTGMLQAAILQGGCPTTNTAPGTINVFLSSQPWTGVTLGAAWTNHFLSTGPYRVCPMLSFSSYTITGTGAGVGVFSSAVTSLNYPVEATDGTKNLYGLWISAGAWTNAPTATTNLLTLTGIGDGKAAQTP